MQSEGEKSTRDENRFISDTVAYLYDLLSERKARNPAYSVRAFARNIGLSPAFVSQVLSGKRNLSLSQKLKLASTLGITIKEFPVKLDEKKPKLNLEIIEQTLEHEKILKYWYHFAILSMAQMSELYQKESTIAKRLGITLSEVTAAIKRLVNFGYLEKSAGKLVRTKTPFIIDSKKSSQSLRQFHRIRLFAAEQELHLIEQTRIDQRCFQTLFIPSSKAKVKAAKNLITQFQEKLIAFLMEDQPDELFQLSLQLFSAENPKRNKGSKS